MRPIFKLQVTNGKADFDQWVSLVSYIETLKDGDYTVKISRKIDIHPRSIEQNKYYWGCVLELISEHTGYTPEESHEIMKAMFLSHHYVINNQIIVGSRSTTTLDTVQMEEYLEKIRRWAATEGVNIPTPNEVDYESTSQEAL